MTYRRTMKHRKWLHGAAYDKYAVPSIVHFDLYCYRSKGNAYYFEVYSTVSGKKPLAFTRLAVCPVTDTLVPCEGSASLGMKETYWSARTASLFERHHGALLAGCTVPDGYRSRSVHCHYVKAYDADPWPRGTLNTWREPEYGEGKRPGRPRSTPLDAPEIL